MTPAPVDETNGNGRRQMGITVFSGGACEFRTDHPEGILPRSSLNCRLELTDRLSLKAPRPTAWWTCSTEL
ncbi:hypothetical protein L209DRAFT_748757 [Thermothelomyces heterothallicus CBS 203.75]